MTATDFDARAATWDDDPAKVERAQAVADAMAREVPLARSLRALEYGCGTGLLSFLLRPRLGDITLADVSTGMFDVAAGKIAAACDPAMRAVKLDLLIDPLPDTRFDLVYSLMALHHIPDTAAILQRFHAGEYSVLVTSQVLNEGVDVPSAGIGIVLSGTGSVREHVQRLGRLLRKFGGKQAMLYEVVARGTAEEFTSEKRRQHHAYQ